MKIKVICASIFIGLILMNSINSFASGYQVTLRPRFSVDGNGTNNVFLTEEVKDTDFITSLSPGADLEVLGKLSGLILSYDPSFAKYTDFEQNDTLRHDFDLKAWTAPTKTSKLQFRNSFLFVIFRVSGNFTNEF